MQLRWVPVPGQRLGQCLRLEGCLGLRSAFDLPNLPWDSGPEHGVSGFKGLDLGFLFSLALT